MMRGDSWNDVPCEYVPTLPYQDTGFICSYSLADDNVVTTSSVPTTTMSTTTPPIPTTTMTTQKESALLIGGYGTRAVIEWNPTSQHTSRIFSKLPEYAGPASRCAVLKDKIYSCGGHVSEAQLGSKKCFAASTDGGSWSRVEDMNVKRFGFTLTAVGDQLVATGGTRQGLRSVEIYKVGSGWRTANWTLDVGAYRHCAVALSDSQIMVVSGRRMSITVYDMTNAARETVDPPSEATTFVSHKCVRLGDYLYVSSALSYSPNMKVRNLVWVYQMSRKTWRDFPEYMAYYYNSLAILKGNLTVFDRDGVQVLHNQMWQRAAHQPQSVLQDGDIVLLP